MAIPPLSTAQLPQATSALLVRLAEASALNQGVPGGGAEDASTRVDERPAITTLADNEEALKHCTQYARLITICFDALFKSILREDGKTGAAVVLKEAEFNAVHSHLFSHLGVMTTSPVIWLVKLAHSNNSPATTTTSGHKHDQRIFGHTLLVFAIRIMATFETALMLDANLSEHARPADSARTARQVVDKIRDAIAAAPASLAVYGQSLNAESIKDGPQGGLAPASTAFSIFLSFVDDCIEAQNGPYPINIAFRFGNESSANVADPFDDSHSVITLRSPTHCHAAILSALSIVQLLLSRCEMLRTHYGRFVYLLTIAIRSLSAATPMEALANVRRSYLDLAVGVSRAESSQKNTDQLTVAVLEMSSQIVLDDEASPVETIAAAHALQFVTSIPRPSLALSASLATVFARRKVRLLAVAQDQSSSIFRRYGALALLTSIVSFDADGASLLADLDLRNTVPATVELLADDADPVILQALRVTLSKLQRDPRASSAMGNAGRKRSREEREADSNVRVRPLKSLFDIVSSIDGSTTLVSQLKKEANASEVLNVVLATLITSKDEQVTLAAVKALSVATCFAHFDAANNEACTICDVIDEGAATRPPSEHDLPSPLLDQAALRLRALWGDNVPDTMRRVALDAQSRLIRHSPRMSSNLFLCAKAGLAKANTSADAAVRLSAQALFATVCVRVEDDPAIDEAKTTSQLRDLVDEAAPRPQDKPVAVMSYLAAIERALRRASPRGPLEMSCIAVLCMHLGHEQDFIRHVARTCIDRAAAQRDMRPYSFFRPHIPWLIPLVTERMQGKILARLPAVFGQSPSAFNGLTSAYSVPILVRDNNRKALESMAASLNVPLATFLMRSDAVDPVAVTTLFNAYMERDAASSSRYFRNLMAIVGVDPKVTLAGTHTTFKVLTISLIAFELGDDNPDRVQQATTALVEFEKNCKTVSSPTAPSVLKDNAVGIMTFLNRVLNESSQLRLPSDRKKAIRSLAKMIELAGGILATYSAQINATLLGAIAQDALRETALRALRDFMAASKYRQIGPFVAQTTATIVRLWPSFKVTERKAAAELIQYIVKNAGGDLRAFQRDIADMSHIDELRPSAEVVKDLRRDWSFNQRVHHLLHRMSGDNAIVVHQAIDELRALLRGHEKRLRSMTSGDAFHDLIGRILQALFNVAAKEGSDFQAVREVAYSCIGLIGAADPDRVTMPPHAARFILVHNFDDQNENVTFALHLLKDYLVKSYQGSTDTKQQGAFAYVIHRLLTYCGFDDSIVSDRSNTKVPQTLIQIWDQLPDSVVSVCTPLLGVFLQVAYRSETAKSHPIYSSTHEYRDWIRIWVHHLMSKMTRTAVKDFFDIFGPVLNMDDTSLAQALLPHAVLHVLISGEDSAPLEACQEVQAVLADQVNPGGHSMSATNRLLAAETIFALMDHLSQWLTQARQLIAQHKPKKRSDGTSRRAAPPDLVEAMKRVDAVFQNIPHIMIGQAALNCRAYARSLLNFELHIQQHSKKSHASVQECFENLHECYANLDEPDGMEGVSPEILTPSLRQQIREHESTGRWTSAQSCWELRLQQDSNDAANHVGLLRCLQSLGHYDSMRIHIAGVLAEHSQDQAWRAALAPYQIEAAMIVGDWSGIQEVLKVPNISGPSVAFGQVATAIRNGDKAQVNAAIASARNVMGEPIGATGKESYRRVYDAATYLHMLHDLEFVYQISSRSAGAVLDSSSLELLASRLSAASPAFRTQELLLNMQRNSVRVINKSGGDRTSASQIGILWLETSKIARNARHLQTAYSAVLQANEISTPWTFVEEAKLSHMTGDVNKAVRIMANGLSKSRDESAPGPYVRAKVKGSTIARGWLTQTRWQHAAGRLDMNQVVDQYKQASKLSEHWESPYYHLGHYHDSLTGSLADKKGSRLTEALQRRELTVDAFSSALSYGTKYLYQALPRMLTLWLELGDHSEVMRGNKFKKANNEKGMEPITSEYWMSFVRINRRIDKNVKTLPSYLWLAVLPQVVSRIVHKNDTLFRVLEKILVRVLTTYPHQAFWGMAAGPKSTVSLRSKRSLAVFSRAKAAATDAVMSKKLPIILDQGLALVDQLLKVCDHPISKGDTLSLRKTFPSLDRLAPISVAIPTLDALTVSLPFDAVDRSEHKPFPDPVVTFSSFEDAVKIMSSLQRPRKISVIGSDANVYGFLCKPKDDLRKDARLMEFNSMINKLLKKDSDSRQRKLKIRTYQVVPLNEECGFIEWVPNVLVLRTIFNDYYSAKNIPFWNSEIKRLFESIREQTHNAGTIFEKQILPKFPAVFHHWFLDTYPDPTAWLQARMNYSRTCAVMSMIGFVLGLGDRHTENILIDGRTGDTVHVDFNCLFDKGRALDIPEKVPFRLTQNLIDGMGVTGVEGVYRKSCEISLSILRTNKDSLMSVLETFLHDPLYEWTSKRKSKNGNDEDMLGREARRSLDPISWKLRGVQVTSDPASRGEKEVSIGEQVERLIREAVSSQNLGGMYVGWAPHY